MNDQQNIVSILFFADLIAQPINELKKTSADWFQMAMKVRAAWSKEIHEASKNPNHFVVFALLHDIQDEPPFFTHLKETFNRGLEEATQSTSPDVDSELAQRFLLVPSGMEIINPPTMHKWLMNVKELSPMIPLGENTDYRLGGTFNSVLIKELHHSLIKALELPSNKRGEIIRELTAPTFHEDVRLGINRRL